MCLRLQVTSTLVRNWQPWQEGGPGVNFINVFMRGFFAQKTKKLLVFENKFHHAFSYKNCAGCVIHKLLLTVLVAIRKLQLAMRKKSFKKPCIKMLMKLTPVKSLTQVTSNLNQQILD